MAKRMSAKKKSEPTDLYARHKLRQKKRRRMKIFIRSFWACVLLAIAVMAIMFFTPMFNISDITVSGNTIVTTDSIIGASNQVLIKGNNIYRTSMKKAEEAIEKIPYVKNASVTRKWPSVVMVEIAESHAVGSVNTGFGYVLFDEDNKTLNISSGKSESAPEIIGLEINNAQIGCVIEVSDTVKLVDLNHLISGLEKMGAYSLVHSIDITDENQVTFVYGGGITVKFGDLYDIDGKLMVFDTMLSDTDRIKPYSKGTIDLRIEGNGYYNSN